jgi:hypothetical protein
LALRAGRRTRRADIGAPELANYALDRCPAKPSFEPGTGFCQSNPAMIRFGLAVFVSAWLVFTVQPLMGRLMLPAFGGLALVWTTSVMTFQALLLLGYAWAHLLRCGFSPRVGALLHLGLVVAAAFALPLSMDAPVTLADGAGLSWQVAWLLAVSAGPVFVLLSATGPLVQAWHALEAQGNPYRLYALSNVGSLVGLLGYPLVLENWLGLALQNRVWSCGYLLFAVLIAWSARTVFARKDWNGAGHGESTSGPPVSGRAHPAGSATVLAWLLLTAVPSALMLAVSTVLSQEVASFPFLWVLPLSAYLVSWIVAFDRPEWYCRPLVFGGLLLCASTGLILWHVGTNWPLALHMLGLPALTFFGGWVCHAELEQLKPPAEKLTGFWLVSSLGGLLGSAVTVILAPLLLTGFFEFHLAVAVTLAIGFAGLLGNLGNRDAWRLGGWTIAVLVALSVYGASFFQSSRLAEGEGRIAVVRGPYGVVAVVQRAGVRFIVNGQTIHGRQYLDAQREHVPLDYYAADRGVGRVIEAARQRAAGKPVRLGVIGLGGGVLAGWARPGDRVRFYELSPDVVTVAGKWFSWLEHARFLGTLEEPIMVGDARVSLAAEIAAGKPGRFDVLVVDAFTSDSIPVHLLTRECMALYRQHLAPGGVVAIHISNRSLDLRRILRDGGAEPGWAAKLYVNSTTDFASSWVVAGPRALIADERLFPGATPWPVDLRTVPWTDDYNCVMWLIEWNKGFAGGRLAQPQRFPGEDVRSPSGPAILDVSSGPRQHDAPGVPK